MTTEFTEGRHAGEFLMSEGNGKQSRRNVTLEGGFTDAGVIVAGTVMGKLTSGGHWVVSPHSGADGSQTGVGVLLYNVDVTDADVEAVMIVGPAEVNGNCLTYDSTVDDADKEATKNAQLLAVGIIVR